MFNAFHKVRDTDQNILDIPGFDGGQGCLGGPSFLGKVPEKDANFLLVLGHLMLFFGRCLSSDIILSS